MTWIHLESRSSRNVCGCFTPDQISLTFQFIHTHTHEYSEWMRRGNTSHPSFSVRLPWWTDSTERIRIDVMPQTSAHFKMHCDFCRRYRAHSINYMCQLVNRISNGQIRLVLNCCSPALCFCACRSSRPCLIVLSLCAHEHCSMNRLIWTFCLTSSVSSYYRYRSFNGDILSRNLSFPINFLAFWAVNVCNIYRSEWITQRESFSRRTHHVH